MSLYLMVLVVRRIRARTLRIAVIQMKSLDHDIDGNLRQATTYADAAAARGAQFALFPEFMATGSCLLFDTWDSAEPSENPCSG
jgi:predicted amidohydrolase